jgi:hypothetical protein
LIDGCHWGLEVVIPVVLLGLKVGKMRGEDLLVQDSSEDGEAGHTEDTEKNEFPLPRQLGSSDHGQRDQDETEVRADVEDHLNDRVIVVGRALEVLDGHSPILVERAAEDTIVNNLDDDEPNPYVPKESPHCHFEAGKITAAKN